MGVQDDLLPDTNPYRERTLAGNIALGLGFVMIVFITTGFVTPNWLEADPRFYGSQLEKLGLWVHCFRSYPDQHDLTNTRRFVACRWIFNPFTEGYAEIRYLLVPRKSNYNYQATGLLFVHTFIWETFEQNQRFFFFSIFCGHSVLLHTLLHWNVDCYCSDSDVSALH